MARSNRVNVAVVDIPVRLRFYRLETFSSRATMHLYASLVQRQRQPMERDCQFQCNRYIRSFQFWQGERSRKMLYFRGRTVTSYETTRRDMHIAANFLT